MKTKHKHIQFVRNLEISAQNETQKEKKGESKCKK